MIKRWSICKFDKGRLTIELLLDDEITCLDQSLVSLLVNGIAISCDFIENTSSNKAHAFFSYDFVSVFVETISLLIDGSTRLSGEDQARQFLTYSSKLIHSNIQMRRLSVAGGLRYLYSLQAYLWVQRFMNELEHDEYLALTSYCLCCSFYRIMERAKPWDNPDAPIIDQHITSIVSRINTQRLSNAECRWLPSLQYVKAQYLVSCGKTEDAICVLISLVENIPLFIYRQPITAYNLSLACCLLTAILDSHGDDRSQRYRNAWQSVFRSYSPIMEIRYGTMHEYQVLYDAWMINLRLNEMTVLNEGLYIDKRFKPVDPVEVYEKCIRVDVHAGTKIKIMSQISA